MRWSLVVTGPPGLPLVPSEVHAVDLETVTLNVVFTLSLER